MRRYIVFSVLLVMFIGFGVLLGLRSCPGEAAPDGPADAGVAAGDGGDGGAALGGDGSPGEADGGPAVVPPQKQVGDGSPATEDGDAAGDGAPGDGGAAATDGGLAEADGSPTKTDGPAKLMDRPLRVVGQGWELVAPGLVANRGTTPGDGSLYREAGLDVNIRVSSKAVDIERALARGGADEEGADVAIMPLSGFVSSYGRLQALAPKVFFIAGWSRGNEAFLSSTEAPLRALPPGKAQQLVADAGSPSHFFGLFLLDLAGTPPAKVSVVPPTAVKAAALPFAALSRAAADADPATGSAKRSVVMTTAEAEGLVPYVAVAPAGTIDAEAASLEALCSQWLIGAKQLRGDVPQATRQIASLQGAPEALELLGSLARVESSSVADNAADLGLSGGGADIGKLFQRTWRVWQAARVVTSAMPAKAPVDRRIVAALVKAGGPAAEVESGLLGAGETEVATPGGDEPEPLLVHRIEGAEVDDDALVTSIGFLSSVFKTLPLRVAVTAKNGKRAQAIADTARGRYGLSEKRLTATNRVSGRKAAASIELFPRP